MGKNEDGALRAICRACGHAGIVRSARPRRLVCSRCGGRDYGFAVVDPVRPKMRRHDDAGPLGADIRLPPAPPIDPAAWACGCYPPG